MKITYNQNATTTNETTIFTVPIRINNPIFFSPLFLNLTAFLIPNIEDMLPGMGINREPIIEMDENIEYIIPLLVGSSNTVAIEKATTRLIPTTNGIPTNNNTADFLFIDLILPYI